jgi:hypothetical protein
MLDSIGYCWDPCEAQWLSRLQEMTNFRDKNGHCVIPANYSFSPKLQGSGTAQRHAYRNSKEGKRRRSLTKSAFVPFGDGLEFSIGFDWNTKDKFLIGEGLEFNIPNMKDESAASDAR